MSHIFVYVMTTSMSALHGFKLQLIYN